MDSYRGRWRLNAGDAGGGIHHVQKATGSEKRRGLRQTLYTSFPYSPLPPSCPDHVGERAGGKRKCREELKNSALFRHTPNIGSPVVFSSSLVMPGIRRGTDLYPGGSEVYWFNPAVSQGESNSVGSIISIQLAKDGADVILDCLLADIQNAGDFFIGIAFCNIG